MLALLLMDPILVALITLASLGAGTSPYWYKLWVSYRMHRRVQAKIARDEELAEEQRTEEEEKKAKRYPELLVQLANEGRQKPSPFGVSVHDEDLALLTMVADVVTETDANILEDLLNAMGREILVSQMLELDPFEDRPTPNELLKTLLDEFFGDDEEERQQFVDMVRAVIVLATYCVAENLTRVQLLLMDPYYRDVKACSGEYILEDDKFCGLSSYDTANVFLCLINEMWEDYASRNSPKPKKPRK